MTSNELTPEQLLISMIADSAGLHNSSISSRSSGSRSGGEKAGSNRVVEITEVTQETEYNSSQQEIESSQDPMKFELDAAELITQEALGSGSQGEVYRAIWWKRFANSTSAITVAMKQLHKHAGQKAHLCEALTLNISHPNLVQCFDATTRPPYIIVSEYCAGGSLYDLLHKTKQELTWRQRLQILLDIAEGMEYLHSLVPIILHRDLKSCNVLLTKRITSTAQRPTAKVTDFGLSRVLQNNPSYSHTSMTACVGTWRWMAPEVFSNTSYDERIDIFSFAIVMFEVLAREIPYADTWPVSATSNPRAALHVRNGNRPNVDRVHSGCPTQVIELMQACWAEHPEQRPDFSMVRGALEGLMQQDATIVGTASF